MKRLVYQNLLEWKEAKERKPLVLLGARQVGKTYIVKAFGRNEFEGMLYVNCHNNKFAEGLFHNFDTDRILYQLEQARDGGSVYPVLWENEDPITPEDYVIYKESELEE